MQNTSTFDSSSRLSSPSADQCEDGRQPRRSKAYDHKNYVPEFDSSALQRPVTPPALLLPPSIVATSFGSENDDELEDDPVDCKPTPGDVMKPLNFEESDTPVLSIPSMGEEPFLPRKGYPSVFSTFEVDMNLYNEEDDTRNSSDYGFFRNWVGPGSPECAVCFMRELDDGVPLNAEEAALNDFLTSQKLTASEKLNLCMCHSHLAIPYIFEPQLADFWEQRAVDLDHDPYIYERYNGSLGSRLLWENYVADKASRYFTHVSSISTGRVARKAKRRANEKQKLIFETQMMSAVKSVVSGEASESLKGMSDSINKLANEGLGLSDEFMSGLAELNSTLSSFRDELTSGRTHMYHQVNIGTAGPIDGILQSILEHKDTIGIALCCLVLVTLYNAGGRKLAVFVCLLSFLVYRYRKDLSTLLRFVTLTQIEVQPQMVDSSFIKAVVTIAHLSIFKGVDSDRLTDKFTGFYKHFMSVPGKVQGTVGTFSEYVRLFQDLITQTCKWIDVEPPSCIYIDKYPQSTSLLKEVEFFLRTPPHSKDLSVTSASSTCQLLKSRVIDLLLRYKSDKDFAGDRLLLSRARSALETYFTELELRGSGKDVTRVPPMAFLFMGKPSIGKSYMLKSLSLLSLYTIHRNDDTALKYIKENQLRDYIFTRNSSDKYWEGYFNQTLVLLDEVGMQRDTATADAETNEYSNFIKMVNDVPFPLLMASVEKKGAREFTSPVVLGTTNCFRFNIESITNPSAYDRRWCAFEVKVKESCGSLRFGDGRTDDWLVPDFKKMRENGMSDEDIALSRFLEFRPRVSVLSEGYKPGVLTIDDVIRLMKDQLVTRDQEFVSRKRQNEILHSYFQRSFTPQSADDYCCCPTCSSEMGCTLTAEQNFALHTFIGGEVSPEAVSEAYSSGFNRVSSKDSYLYTNEFVCMAKHAENCKLAKYAPQQICFSYGAMVMSEIQRGLVKRKHDEFKRRATDIATKASIVFGTVLAALGTYKLLELGFSALFGRSSTNKGEDDDLEPQVRDLNSQEVLYRVMRRNVYAVSDDLVPFRGCLTFVADNVCVFPKHFQIAWKAEWEKRGTFYVHLRRLGDNVNHQVIKINVEYFIDVSNTTMCGNDDLVFVYIAGDQVQKHANIRKYLVDHVPNSGEISFPVLDKANLKYSHINAKFSIGAPVEYKARGVDLQVCQPVMYNIPTAVGDCGLPIAQRNPLFRSEKIFGIHVAGCPQQGIGISAPITALMLDNVLEHFSLKYNLIHAQYRTDPKVIIDMDKEGKTLDDLYFPSDTILVPGKVNLGIVDPPVQPCSTNIIPSPIFNKIGVPNKTKPARLRPFINSSGVYVDPIALSNNKYHLTTQPLDIDILKLCRNSVTSLWLNGPMIKHNPKVGPRLLSFEEAVAGIPGIRGLEGIPRATSAGYPRVCYVEKKGKKDFFGDGDSYEFTSQQCVSLRTNVERILSDARKGIRGTHVYLDFPKDERRPLDRVEAGKTRKISACPIDLTIAIRVLFGSFCQFVFENRIFNESAIGVNPFDKEWDNIVSYIGANSKAIAGDHSNYDGHLPYVVMMQFLETVTDYYGDRGSDNELARKVIFLEISNSRHVVNGTICEWVGSNASGNPLTPVLNTYCNLVLTRYAIVTAVGVSDPHECVKFLNTLSDSVRIIAYGDDNLIGVIRKSPWESMITQDSLTEAFAKMGLEYTDELKGSGNVSQDRSIREVGFLKRGFRYVESVKSIGRHWLSPLSLDTILESIQWTKKKDYDYQIVKDNIVNMLQELSQHDRCVFDEYAPRVIEASREHLNYMPVPSSYEDCQSLILSRDGMYFN
nr:MAG: RNA-dependent RNA polymerase [brine shrimp dicistro-like virus 1]